MGALIKKGALIRMGALIAIGRLLTETHLKGALIGRRALNRIFTVV